MAKRPVDMLDMAAQAMVDIGSAMMNIKPAVTDGNSPQDKGWRHIGDVMSNFDHEIEEDAEAELRAGECYGDYAGWNFFGQVWFADDKFHCYVLQYRRYKETLSADSLKGLMTVVSEEYGWK